MGSASDAAPQKLSAPKNVLAWICHQCPFCRHARSHPTSLLGRIMHHPLHADHCPLWKAERQRYPQQ
ncbi:MAG TPA: hypothetical protein VMG58_07755 [Candidatus Sulfotelmatobacter sp.]|nr:hypothetical protein [Candidatus Sulfotelmatobacter sp.]